MRCRLCPYICWAAIIVLFVALGFSFGWVEFLRALVLLLAVSLGLWVVLRFLRWLLGWLAPLIRLAFFVGLFLAAVAIILADGPVTVPDLYVYSAVLFFICGVALSHRAAGVV
jgi:hypothetical protein